MNDNNEDDECEIDLPTVWIVTREQFERLFEEDQQLQDVTPEDPKATVGRLYIRYARLIERLDRCWNETSQPQKNQAMRRLLDAAIKRLLELRTELIDLHTSEIQYLDEELIQLKSVPYDLEIVPLSMFPLDRAVELQDFADRLYRGERIYIPPEELEGKMDEDVKVEVKAKMKRPVIVIDPKVEAIKNAVELIQRHERGRQYKLEFFDEKTMYDIRENRTVAHYVPKEIGTECAIKMQSLCRGFHVRRKMRLEDNRRKLLIGMEIPSWKPTEIQDKDKENQEYKKTKRKTRLEEFKEACMEEKARLLRVVGPRLMEDIVEEIRWWFQNWYDVAKAFDKYPPVKKGGTIIVIRGETRTPEEYRDDQERKRRQKQMLKDNPLMMKKMQADAKKEEERLKKEKEQKEKEKKAAKKKKKRKKDSDEPEPWKFKPSEALPEMQIADELFDKDWTHLDEELLKKDEILMEKITDVKAHEVQLEMRKAVDEMMRVELEMLQIAHARDRRKKPPKRKKRGRKRKGRKGKKDPTRKRPIEDIFQELYDNGIIRKYPLTDINSFIGDYSYRNMEFRNNSYDPLHFVRDIIQSVTHNCIIPFGGREYPKPKSVCICGPRQSGKKLLAYGICTAINAVLFDLSPEVIHTQYQGKEETKMLLLLINKMARILQPSVFFVNGAERTFCKKIPKSEIPLDPTRFKKILFKNIVKPIQPAEQLMLIGVSSKPWDCRPKPFRKAYERFIIIPRTDYNTVYHLWTEILMKYHGVERKINLTALAMLTEGYPIPYIQKIVEQVLVPERIIRFHHYPLQQHELLEALMYGGTEPVLLAEQDKFTNWYNKKTKLGRAMRKVVKAAEEQRRAEELAAEKAKALAEKNKAKGQFNIKKK